MRGYRENQFLGSAVAWGGVEYRYLLNRFSFLSGFLDLGYVARPADDRLMIPESRNTLIGYGIGFQFDTSLGLLGVSYALGRGDTFSTGKIHFGLINTF